MIFNKKLFSTKLLVVIALTTGIFACSSSDDEDPREVVAELIEFEPLFEPEVIWDASVGYGVEDHFSRIKPAVAYGKVFSASREGDVIAFDQASGDELWDVDLSDINNERSFFESRKSAQLAGGMTTGMNKVFIGNENGNIYALDAETGELVWQNTIKGEIINAPAMDSGILVVNSASGVLQAFNATTGEDLWKIEQDVPALTLRGMSSPVIASGGVLIGQANGDVSVYLLDKGQKGWSTTIGEASGSTELQRVIDVDTSPVVFGDKVYSVSSRGNLAAIELRTGNILWKRQYSSYRQISIDGNSIFFTTDRGHVFSVNRNDGLEQWSNLTMSNRGVTGPVIYDDYIVVGDFEGYLHWLSQETGEVVARHYVDGSGIHSTPTVVDGVLYSQARDGELEAIQLPK
mgnify:CR=1 FL=1